MVLEIKKRQTGRRAENITHSYIISVVNNEQWEVKQLLRPTAGRLLAAS